MNQSLKTMIFRCAVIGGILGVLFELAYIEYSLQWGFGWTELEFGEWIYEYTLGLIIK